MDWVKRQHISTPWSWSIYTTGQWYCPSLWPCAGLLGVIISADLSLDRHVSVVSSAPFYWLRQLRRVNQSLDDESVAILVHVFVTSRIDYCNLLLAGEPKSVTDKLQWVMNAAARVVSGRKKYDHGLTHLLHSELHWLMSQIESHTSFGWRCTSATCIK